jgi:hypothetical protein
MLFRSIKRRAAAFGASVAMLIPAGASIAGNVVIQEIYGGGGQAAASTYNFDYVVLYNRSSTAQPIAGWSVQYAAAAGAFGSASLKVDIPAAALPLQPGQFYLVRLGSSNTAIGGALPLAPDASSASNSVPNISAAAGKVALVRNTVLLPATNCPLPSPDVEDFVGYGATADCREGAANGPGGGNATSVFRKNISNGCVDTDQNGNDIDTAPPVARNTTVFAFCAVACCDAQGNCVAVANPGACNGSPLPNTACQPNPCPQPAPMGACCLANNNCVFGTPTQCQNAPGYYLGDSVVCAGINCGLGACCNAQGACGQVASAAACNNAGGAFMGFGVACIPNPCAQPTGACCTAAGCSRVTAAFCAALGGHYAGDNVACGAVNCDTGACCLPNGNCNQVNVAQDCVQQGGTFQGLGVPCVPVPCAPVTGACCTAAGACSQTTAGQCGGTFLGVGVACSATACKGACCTTGGCVIQAQTACTGAFQGFNTACTPDPCPAQTGGACCLPAGGCTGAANAGACNGTYMGDGTSCNPDPCDGVCCAGAVCANLAPGACNLLPNSIFVFTALNCSPSATVPCCRADYNHTGGLSVQDIFDFLNGWFAGSPLADINGGGLAVQDIFDFLNAWFAGCP